jgi:hypothetical protein
MRAGVDAGRRLLTQSGHPAFSDHLAGTVAYENLRTRRKTVDGLCAEILRGHFNSRSEE